MGDSPFFFFIVFAAKNIENIFHFVWPYFRIYIFFFNTKIMKIRRN